MDYIIEMFTNAVLAIQQLILEGFMILAGLLTGKTKIERIMYHSTATPSNKVLRIEQALKSHEKGFLREIAWSSGEETTIAEDLLPNIEDKLQKEDFSKALARSMRQIRGYNKLCDLVEARRATHYDSEDPEHEAKLLQLWELMKPEEELKARRSSQWQDIGFQGDDPATDFRGMGILGLEQLIFFAKYDHANALHCLKVSHYPRTGFPYAVCGITVTALIRELLFEDMLKNHFYNALKTPPTLDNFHQVY
uniref:ELMO domain-containing protein n=1 Tax=Panagrolaimus sp. JU765 TaxID=591449 RepID=A0AC34Q725_9BILA